jgi:hypothetical protein
VKRFVHILVFAAVVLTAATGASGASNVGYDISYPQCGGAFPSGGAFGIVGVNDGRPFSANPCLGVGSSASELQWAGMNAGLYANTADPGPALSTHWPNGQTAPKQCNTTSNPGSDTPECHYDYGWNAAADGYQDAGVGADRFDAHARRERVVARRRDREQLDVYSEPQHPGARG